MAEKRYATNQPVKVKTEGHVHFGRAGTVVKQTDTDPDNVVVFFDATPDLPSISDSVNYADIQELR